MLLPSVVTLGGNELSQQENLKSLNVEDKEVKTIPANQLKNNIKYNFTYQLINLLICKNSQAPYPDFFGPLITC